MIPPLLIREMLPSERALVLSDWKHGLREQKPAWGAHLRGDEWWAVVNFVIDRITLPSVTVWMACYRDEPLVPLAWLAKREGVLFAHATGEVLKKPELAAYLESSLRSHGGKGEDVDWNPYLELKRPCPSFPSAA